MRGGGWKPGVGIDKHNLSLFLKVSYLYAYLTFFDTNLIIFI